MCKVLLPFFVFNEELAKFVKTDYEIMDWSPSGC